MGTEEKKILDSRRRGFNWLLREIRESKRIKQIEIARETGLSKQMISKMEGNNGNPTLETLMKYCFTIGVDLEDAIRFRYVEGVDGRILELEEQLEEWIHIFDVLNDRENRHKWLDYWRKKEGKGDLWYPDGDQVYKDFWELKGRNEDLEMIIADLKTLNKALEAINADLEKRVMDGDIVHCRDCKNGTVDWPWESPFDEVNYCNHWCRGIEPDDYCSWGEKND